MGTRLSGEFLGYPLKAYDHHYNPSMIFVEKSPFAAFKAEHWTDEDLRGLTPSQVKALANLMKDINHG